MIWFENCNKRYYGSTTTTLTKRLSQHKTHYKNKTSKCSLFTLFDEYGLENAKIELVEAFPCANRSELEAREGFHIRNNTHVNRCITGRTKAESDKAYREIHKEEMKERDRNYYLQNKDRLKAKRKAYYEAHKDEEKKKMRERYQLRQKKKDEKKEK